MLVLLTAVFLLIGAPAGLLVAGRAIGRWTDFKGRRGVVRVAAPVMGGEGAWYQRPMRPAFGRVEEGE